MLKILVKSCLPKTVELCSALWMFPSTVRGNILAYIFQSQLKIYSFIKTLMNVELSLRHVKAACDAAG